MKTELLKACDELVTAALNGTCQGIILVLVVAAGLRWFGRTTNAATRHAVWFATLLLLVLVIPAHCVRDYLLAKSSDHSNASEIGGDESDFETDLSEALPPQEAVAERAVDERLRDPSVWVAGPPVFSLPSPALQRWPEDEVEKTAEVVRLTALNVPDTAEPAEGAKARKNSGTVSAVMVARKPAAAARPAAAEAGSSETPQSSETIPPLAQAILQAASALEAESSDPEPGLWERSKAGFSWFARKLLDPVSWNIAEQQKLPRTASLGLVSIGVLIGAWRVGLLFSRLQQIRRLKRNCFAPAPQLATLFRSLRERLHIRRPVLLGLSEEQRSPVLLGFLHPMILLPSEHNADETEPVLRHELAHVSRRDDWANLVQKVFQALFFFHPAVWWVCRRLTLEREIACDDHVLQQSRSPRTYALLLANLAGRMQGAHALLAPGVSTNKCQLQQRIDMILNRNRNTSPQLAKARLGIITSAAALIALAALYTAPRVVLAQSQAAPAALPASSVASVTATAATPATTPTPSIAPVAVSVSISGDEPATAPPAPVGIGRGPKMKSGAGPAPAPVPPQPIITFPPATVAPVAPLALTPVPVPPTPEVVAVEQSVSEARGDAPAFPRRAGRKDASLEERLERLERMVESLAAQRDGKLLWQRDFNFKGPDMKNWSLDQKHVDEIKQMAKQQAEMARQQADMAKKHLEMAKQQGLSQKEMEKMQADVERQVARAGEEAKRAVRELDRAMREQQPHPKKPQPGDLPLRGREFRSGAQERLEVLRKQHQELERQMERLDRQIEKLEQNQDEQEQEQELEPENADLQQLGEVQTKELTADQPKQECTDSKNAPGKDNQAIRK